MFSCLDGICLMFCFFVLSPPQVALGKILKERHESWCSHLSGSLSLLKLGINMFTLSCIICFGWVGVGWGMMEISDSRLLCIQISEIISRFERKGFKLVAIKIVVPSKDFAKKHYHDLKERPFFNGLCDFLSSGPVIAMVWGTSTSISLSENLTDSP